MMMSPPCGVSVLGGSSLTPGWDLGAMMRVKECRAVLALAQAPAHDRRSVDSFHRGKPTLKADEVIKPSNHPRPERDGRFLKILFFLGAV